MRSRSALCATALVVAFVAAFAPSAAAQSPDPVTCSGYPETRQFVDTQSWWNLPGAEPAHAHLGACIPERESHTADIRFDVRMIMHNMPDAAAYRYLAFVVKGPGYETTVKSFDPDFKCAAGVTTCEKWLTYTLPISAFERSGLQEIRLRASVRDVDGNSVRPSINFVTNIWNGAPRDDQDRRPFLRAKSWYGDDRFFGYCEVGYRSDLTPLPDGPVTSSWAPQIQMVDHADGDVPPSWTEVRLDPDFHMGMPGTLVREGPGEWEGILTPARGAAPGPHKLFAQATCEDERGTNAGVLIIPFTVAGNEPEPEPIPEPSPVRLTAPAAAAVVSGTIRFNATVPSGTTRVGYLVDGTEVAFDATASDFSETWSTTRVPNGEHTVVARATVNGRAIDSAPIKVTVAN
jgi:hypothetical protein